MTENLFVLFSWHTVVLYESDVKFDFFGKKYLERDKIFSYNNFGKWSTLSKYCSTQFKVFDHCTYYSPTSRTENVLDIKKLGFWVPITDNAYKLIEMGGWRFLISGVLPGSFINVISTDTVCSLGLMRWATLRQGSAALKSNGHGVYTRGFIRWGSLASRTRPSGSVVKHTAYCEWYLIKTPTRVNHILEVFSWFALYK